MNDFPMIALLDSPLLPVMAPELVPLRDEALVMAKAHANERTNGCSACRQREHLVALTRFSDRVSSVIDSNQQLKAIVPQLLSTAKQVYDARKP